MQHLDSILYAFHTFYIFTLKRHVKHETRNTKIFKVHELPFIFTEGTFRRPMRIFYGILSITVSKIINST